MPLKVKILNPLATPPTIGHPGEDLGYDVYALRVQHQPIKEDGTPVQWLPNPGKSFRMDMNGNVVQPIRIEYGKPLAIPTGLALHYTKEDGKKYGLEVEDRSSMALRGLFVTAGKIDAGYRGELKIILNLTSGSYADIWPGDKIAQLFPREVQSDEVEVVDSLEESQRGEAGFGSTGK